MTPTFDPKSVLLEGAHVRLEPLEPRHLPLLHDAARGPDVFQWFVNDTLTKPAEMEQWFNDALRAQAAGTEVGFATVRRSDGRVVGSTRFLDIRRPNRGVEIGNTWIAQEAQRSAVNTEAKLLMLALAFETWGAVRVQLKTDARNAASRRAIARLGAVEEGTLRKYQARFDGFVRDTVMFSITAAEWPAVKARLESLLAR